MGSPLMEFVPATSEQFEPYLGAQGSGCDRSRLMRAVDTVNDQRAAACLARQSPCGRGPTRLEGLRLGSGVSTKPGQFSGRFQPSPTVASPN
jgi:hypothetical protein